MGLLSGLRKIADKALKVIPGVNIAYGIADNIAESTGLTNRLNRLSGDTMGANLSNHLDDMRVSNLIDSRQVKPPHTLQMTKGQPSWDRVKTWFIYKWHTAKGMVIGAIVLGLLLLGISFGIIPNPLKRRGW